MTKGPASLAVQDKDCGRGRNWCSITSNGTRNDSQDVECLTSQSFRTIEWAAAISGPFQGRKGKSQAKNGTESFCQIPCRILVLLSFGFQDVSNFDNGLSDLHHLPDHAWDATQDDGIVLDNVHRATDSQQLTSINDTWPHDRPTSVEDITQQEYGFMLNPRYIVTAQAWR